MKFFNNQADSLLNKKILIPIIVSSLGNFVDVYDIIIFSIVRVISLKDFGLTGNMITLVSEKIIGYQMLGFILGGIFWGIAGDKKGRIKILYGSIILYSLANIANAFVQNEIQYSIIRFIAGFGLAGELGGGVTLLCEILPVKKRGLATIILTSCGLLGVAFAFTIKENFHWRTCYIIGGVMGLMLLILRSSALETNLFKNLSINEKIVKGSFLMIFQKWDRAKRYLIGIFLGVPIWHVAGIYFTFANELGDAIGIQNIDSSKAIFYGYLGIFIGDLSCGILSQILKSRRKAIFVFYTICVFFITLFHVILYNSTQFKFYLIITLIGFGAGFWVVIVTTAAEQFGTNLRATAATTIPNMIRGSFFFPILPFYRNFLQNTLHFDIITAAMISSVVWFGIAYLCLYSMKESFHYDLNYYETQ